MRRILPFLPEEGMLKMSVMDERIAGAPGWKRLSPAWLFFSLANLVKEWLIPIILFVINNSDGWWIKAIKILCVPFFFIQLIGIFLQWKNYKYRVTEKEIRIIKGSFVKEEKIIPVKRIQSVEKETSFIHRWFSLTSLKIHLATGEEEVFSLEAIKEKEADEILNRIRGAGKGTADPAAEAGGKGMQGVPGAKTVFAMAPKDIFIASFTSFSFLAFGPFLVSLYLNIDEYFHLSDLLGDLPVRVWESLARSVPLLLLGGAALIVVSLLFGIIVTFLRYGNYRVESDGKRIVIKKGLFNVSELAVPVEKIRAIKWKKYFLRSFLGITEVKLVAMAGNGEDSETKSAVLFPFLQENRAKELVREMFGIRLSEPMEKLPARALAVKLLRPNYLWIIAAVVNFYQWPEYWYASVILLVYILVHRILSFFRCRYRLEENHIQQQGGVWTAELIYLPEHHMDEMVLKTSWLQRRFGLATVEIHIRANPSETLLIEDLPWEKGAEIFRWFMEKRKRPAA